MMPSSKRRAQWQAIVDLTIGQVFAGKILPFNSAAAAVYADIWAKRRAAGKPVSQFDAQIAAIARANGAKAIATRNMGDFAHFGIEIVNPWRAT